MPIVSKEASLVTSCHISHLQQSCARACKNLCKTLRRWILPDDAPHLLLICLFILFEQIERVGLRWRVGVWFVEQRLNPKQDLLDGDCGFPAFLLVENTQTDGAGRVDVRVEERWGKFACAVSAFGYLAGWVYRM
jgi:hypothetical protein